MPWATVTGVEPPPAVTTTEAASLPSDVVLDRLGSTPAGLDPAEADRRRATYGPNAIRTHHARPLAILGRQLRNAVLILLAVTATVSFFLGQRTDTAVIGLILAASVGLGFVNEYRAERATEALHSQVTHRASVRRARQTLQVDVTDLVPGDVVRLVLGELVPADLRLLEATGLQCDESVLTGESLPVDKGTDPVAPGSPLADLDSCALMGTVVHSGSATGVVVATGPRAEFGRIAAGPGRAAARDRVPDRAAPLLGAAAGRRRRPHHADLRGQPAVAAAADRVAAVLAGDRRGHHARNCCRPW